MESKVRPRNGYVLVQIVSEDETRGQIIIPNGAGPFPLRGIVMAVDEQHRLEDGQEMDLHPGDEVLFFKAHTTELRLGEEKSLLIHESKVIAISDPVRVQ